MPAGGGGSAHAARPLATKWHGDDADERRSNHCDIPLAADFEEVVEIDPPWQTRVASRGRFDQTHLARCFVQIIDWLQTPPRPFMLWCHLASLGTIWDAAREFRRRYMEEGDPPPPHSARMPDRRMATIPIPTIFGECRNRMPARCLCWTRASGR